MIWEIVGSILFSVVAAEIYAACPWLTSALLKRARRALPKEYQDRYWGEWLGELDAQRDFGNLRKLAWALGVFLSSGRTAKTLDRSVGQGRRIAPVGRYTSERRQRELEIRVKSVVNFCNSIFDKRSPGTFLSRVMWFALETPRFCAELVELVSLRISARW